MTEDDLDEVLRVESLSSPSPWARPHFAAALRGRGTWSWVVRRDGRAIAFACGAAVEDEIELQNLAVDPRERGRGLGSFLLARFLDAARARGCRRAFLEVRASNEGALALYRKFGFERYGFRRGYYARLREDAVLMAAVLENREPVAGNGE